jgi:uncharacterized ferritin-like protein (DUF455 family)
MKKFMVPDELQRDERFSRTAVPLDFLMAEEVTVEQVEETMMNLLGNDEVRKMMEDGAATGGAPNVLKRVRPDEDDAPIFIKSQMHGIFMGEMQALEAAGRSAWDFTDDDELPWKFQLDMARQCWDETRHVEIYSALLDHVDCEIGEFAENVVGVNRCLEGLALDVFNDTIRFGKAADDEAIWRSVDYVAADEVTHVRFGQVWSKALTENDPARRKKVVDFQRKVDRAFSLGGLRGSYDGANQEKFLPLAIEFRKLAGFSDEDIADVAGAGPKVVKST